MPAAPDARWLERRRLQELIDALSARGYRVLGPVVREAAVVLDEVRRAEELPAGWRDVQEPGSYRLERAAPRAAGGGEDGRDRADDPGTGRPLPGDPPDPGDARVFDVVNGPESLKRHVFAPREELLRIQIPGDGGPFRAGTVPPDAPRLAVLGVRACDLAGLAVQDRIFLRDRFPDPYYGARRRGLFLVAVSCTRSVSTCFCASMGTGPEATSGFDLALTELDGGFTLRAGSPAGEDLLGELDPPPAEPGALERERAALDACAAGMKRHLDTRDLPDVLYDNLEHPRWNDVAGRCLSCGNCTMVCPTCFCHDERDEPSLDGSVSLRVREWDSCFNPEHAQVHGTNFRPRIRNRYRQWLVHKVASWIDQFGTSGCVGCGRCITWCPVGIDLTEEVAALREEPGPEEPG